MKVCLGMMVHTGDAPWLRLHLPVVSAAFDGAVFSVDPLDVGDAEMEALLLFCTASPSDGKQMTVVNHAFKNDWSDMFNSVIERAEMEQYTSLIRLDPDELMHPASIDNARALLEQYIILCFPRYNFWGDRTHYTPGIFPDWQCRAWLLGKGIRLGGQHHEGVGWLNFNMFEGDPIDDTPRQVLRVPHLPIYHYGNVGRERILERDLHYVNVDREKAGHPPLTERPEGRAFPRRHSILFTGEQPIDPDVCGLYAPWTE